MRPLLFALVALSLACSSDPTPPQTDAGGAVDLGVADSAPCGGACGAGTVCEGGRCVAADAGQVDAGADAGEVVCGTTQCARRPGATASCGAGGCAYACQSGFGDCNNDPSDGCETPTSTSPLNCGGCGRSCNFARCVAGACVCDPAPLRVCGAGATCVDISTSTSHCGACDRRCGAGQRCVMGACQ